MAIYLNYEGIEGNVTAKGYEGKINLKHCKFGVSRKINMKPGEMANRESTRPTLSIVEIEKYADISTTSLFKESVVGSSGKRATLHFVRTETDKLTEYMTYTLENCLINNYMVYDTKYNKHPKETIQLSYTSILISKEIKGANNQTLNTLRSGYNLEKAISL